MQATSPPYQRRKTRTPVEKFLVPRGPRIQAKTLVILPVSFVFSPVFIKATVITILYLFSFLSFPLILFLLPATRRVFFSFNPITCFRTVTGPAWLVASSSLFGFFCFSYFVYRLWDIWTFSQLPFSCCYFVVLPLSHLIVFWCEMLAVLARVEIWGDWVGKLASWVGPIAPVEMV